MERTLGVRMEERACAPGEAWAPGVRKMALSHPDEGPLGAFVAFPGSGDRKRRVRGYPSPRLWQIFIFHSMRALRCHSGGPSAGDLYLDLLPRRGKFPGAAHFVLRSGRQNADGSYEARPTSPRASLSIHDSQSLAGERRCSQGVF